MREPVSLFPILLRVQAGHDRPATAHIEVCSYVPEMTAPPALAADAPWAVIGVPEPLALPADDPAMSRRWQVPVTLATDKLGPGEFRCEVAVPAGAKHGAGVRVPVEVRVAAPITVSPGQLFFGTVAAGKPTSVTFAVRTPPGHPAVGVTIDHDLGSVLAVEKVSGNAGMAVMRATLTPTAGGELTGTVVVKCPGLPPAKIQVLARVGSDAP